MSSCQTFSAVRVMLDADFPSSDEISSNCAAAGFAPRHHEIVTEVVVPDWPSFVRKSGTARESPGQRLPALVWKVHLLHGAQTRLVQNAAVTGDAPRTLSRLGTERIQGQRAALLKITQEIPVSLQACHGGQCGEPGRGGPGILLRL